jgi:glycosyltransferase involved in cell wall biosynthesis
MRTKAMAMRGCTTVPKRRLLAVCAVAHPGGAEMALLRLLGRIDWDVTLTTPGPGPLSDAGYRCEQLAVGGLARGAGARAVAAWPRTRRLAKGADAVYLNGTVCGRLLPALAGRRTILHVHDIVGRVPRIWRGADVVLADSQAVAERLAPLVPHVVYCPIELDPPQTAPPWTPDGADGAHGGPVVGFVGRIEPRKGPLDLALAAPAIKAAVPAARVVIVGADPYMSDPGYFARVRSAEQVEHYDWVPNAAGLMRHLDVLVAPSRQEPFGTVLAEAMAVGTPVVSTRVGGLAEVVTDGVDGRLVAPGDPRALAAAVIEVLGRREEMGAAARAAARRFDADDYARRVERLLAPAPAR